jgi:hypothetical protein
LGIHKWAYEEQFFNDELEKEIYENIKPAEFKWIPHYRECKRCGGDQHKFMGEWRE